MTYRDLRPDRLRLPTVTFRDWLTLSFVLAVGTAIFMLLFNFAAWLIGMPGPLLWMGSSDRLADIIEVTLTAAMVFFVSNIFGSFVILVFFAVRGRIRSKD